MADRKHRKSGPAEPFRTFYAFWAILSGEFGEEPKQHLGGQVVANFTALEATRSRAGS